MSQAKGLTLARWQEATKLRSTAAVLPPWSLPKNIQLWRPTATLRMARMFRKFAIAVSFSIVAIGAARADTLCNSFGGPQNVASTGFACSLGGINFSGFQVLPSAGNQDPKIDLIGANIAVDGTINLQFDPNMSTPGDGASQAIDFFFVVTGGINQIDLSVDGANASITETVCDAAFGTSNNCTGNYQSEVLGCPH